MDTMIVLTEFSHPTSTSSRQQQHNNYLFFWVNIPNGLGSSEWKYLAGFNHPKGKRINTFFPNIPSHHFVHV